MKKRYLILAGLLVMTVAAAGSGKKKTTKTAPVEGKTNPTPGGNQAVGIVGMPQTAKEEIKNGIGGETLFNTGRSVGNDSGSCRMW